MCVCVIDRMSTLSHRLFPVTLSEKTPDRTFCGIQDTLSAAAVAAAALTLGGWRSRGRCCDCTAL